MIGFTFRNRHSSEFDIGVRSIDRSVIPSMRRNEYIIPGRHGTIDFGGETYDNRQISVKLGLMKNANWKNLRSKSREVAQWLSGKGQLIFDDEPDKAYQAGLYIYVGIAQLDLLPMGELDITFDCQPFAESLEYNQINKPNVVNTNETINLTVSGTSETCCIITIKNKGMNIINGITLTRKARL